MRTQAVFMGGLLVMFFFNVFFLVMQPDAIWTMTVGAITGFVATVLAVGVISGINILGSGLSGSSVKILFGTSALLTIMFQIPIAGFPVGLGLANNIISTFSEADTVTQMFGFFLGTGLSVMTIISGLLTIAGSGGD